MKKLATAKPFLKWAGGKTQILPEIKKNYPKELIEGKVNNYIEPFLGGGAVLFDILNNYSVKNIVANDINRDLIITYKVIQINPEALISLLHNMQEDYYALDEDERKVYYYQKRESYNQYRLLNLDPHSDDINSEKIILASLLIFLNRTCFNGLYRLNRKGEFNVPTGRYKKPLICNQENIRAVSKVIQKVTFTNSTYKEISYNKNQINFLYADPPYRALPNTPSFTSYFNSEFGESEQIQMANWLTEISSENNLLLISNSDPHNTDKNDDFFETHYSQMKPLLATQKIFAKRNINSNSKKRGQISELLIKNY